MKCGPMAGFSPANPQKCCQWLNVISCTDMTMHCASIHRPAGHWPKEKAAGTLTLDFDMRHRRRIRLTTDQGEDVLLDLPKAVAMADGDGLQLEDGRWLKVQAAAELIVEVRHKDPNQLMRLAWHLGNRHLPTEIRRPSSSHSARPCDRGYAPWLRSGSCKGAGSLPARRRRLQRPRPPSQS